MNQPTLNFDQPAGNEPGAPTYSVLELAGAINQQLREGFGPGVWVRGEIDGIRHSGPHTYFSLVEETDSERGVINVSWFAPSKRRLQPLMKQHRLELENGMKVRVFGALDYFARGGRLGLKMSDIDPRFTLGELSQARDQVIRRLHQAGVFDSNRSLPTPTVPLSVGVVTSLGTAAWHDLHNELVASGIGFELKVCHTKVQGEGAERSVATAIATLATHQPDVIVVIRGGGARNELATFDAEPIAFAIATCPIPVFTGIGHEIDQSVADDVAHRCLKTPTACAGALVQLVSAAHQRAEQNWATIAARADRQLEATISALTHRANRVARRTYSAVDRADERVAMRAERLQQQPPRVLASATARVDGVSATVRRRAMRVLDSEMRDLDGRAARMELLDPVNLLRRGWTITRNQQGAVVRSAVALDDGEVITTEFADGVATSIVMLDATTPPPHPSQRPAAPHHHPEDTS